MFDLLVNQMENIRYGSRNVKNQIRNRSYVIFILLEV